MTTTLSLCLIAKNESFNLPRLLNSARQCADEIIVVDTGSTDNTVSIAESLGAKVFSYKWRDDFADAKNEALRQATCGWVLALDADMEIEKGQAQKIRAAAESRASQAFYLNIRSARADGVTVETVAHPWLFENHHDVKFEGKVHEAILPSLLAHYLTPRATDICVTHFGYATERETLERAKRDLKILEKENSEPFTQFYLARAHNRLGHKEKAARLLKRVVSAAKEERLRANAYTLWMRIACDLGDADTARQTIKEATALFPHDRMTLIAASDACIHLGDVARATEFMRRALAAPTQSAGNIEVLERNETAIRFQLAQCLTYLQSIPQAITEYQRVLAGGMATADVYCSLGLAFSLAKDEALAEESFKHAIKLEPQSSEAHRQLGWLYAETQRENLARQEFSEALRLGSTDQELKNFKLQTTKTQI